MKILKRTFILLFIFLSISSFSQPNLKYSGFFDSYYTTGPLKYYVEPGITMMNGELAKSKYSYGVGGGVNYRILPPIYLNSSVRYLSLNSSDHDDQRLFDFKGYALQFNAIGNYHFIYDLVRKSHHRRKGPKKLNAYVTFGVTFNLLYKAKNTHSGIDTYNTYQENQNTNITQLFSKDNNNVSYRNRLIHFPLGLGIPIRVTPRFTFTPEIVTYLSAIIPFIQKGSDYLDGLEYVGESKQHNDTYTFLNFKFMFNPKGKRLKPKKVQATNKGDFEGNEGDFNDSFDDDDGFDSFDTTPEEDTKEEETEDLEETEEEVIDESSEEEEEIIEEEEIEEEEEGDKYDEDGFLIDDK